MSAIEWHQDDTDDYEFQVLSSRDVKQMINEMVATVRHVAPTIPKQSVRTLLHNYHWNSDDLISAYALSNHHQGFFVSARCLAMDQIVRHPKRPPPGMEFELCAICEESREFDDMIGVYCGHRFCKFCWFRYMNHEVALNQSVNITCADPYCNIIVDERMALRLIQGSQDVANMYRKLSLASRVERDPLLRWCAGATCSKIIRVREKEERCVTCTECFTSMCFGCGDVWHGPISCELLEKWWTMVADETGDSQLVMTENQRACPYCLRQMKRQKASNRVVCAQEDCMTLFCWQCSARIFPDMVHRCPGIQSTSKLVRFLHCKNRFVNHNTILLDHSDRPEGQAEDDQDVQNTCRLLRSCHQCIMYAYAMVFFMVKTSRSYFFENLLVQLEISTEKLTMQLERLLPRQDDRDGAGWKERQVQLQDLTALQSICKLHRKRLLENARQSVDEELIYAYEKRENGEWIETIWVA